MDEEQLWKVEYINKIFSNNDEMIKEAEELLNKNKPKTLFKYRYILDDDKYTIKNILEDVMPFKNPKYYNDPYDSAININDYNSFLNFAEEGINNKSFEKFMENIIEKSGLKRLTEKSIELLSNEYNRYIENIKVCCFAEDNDSILMWSHYANEHKGFCIEYDFDEMSQMCSHIYPIKYQQKLCKLIDFNNKNDSIIEPIITKYIDWKYEKEWRMINYCKNENYVDKIDDKTYRYKLPNPIGIYMGCKISQEHEKKLEELCRKKNIKLYRMVMEPSEFKLKSREIRLIEF